MAIVHRCGSCGDEYKRFTSAQRCFERDHKPHAVGDPGLAGQMHADAVVRAVERRRRAQGRL